MRLLAPSIYVQSFVGRRLAAMDVWGQGFASLNGVE